MRRTSAASRKDERSGAASAAPSEEDAGAAQRIEPQRPGHEGAHQPRADQRLAAVADVPAEHHRHRHAALQLGREVRGQRRGEQPPPGARRREQQHGEEQRVRRPQRRDRVRLQGEGEAERARRGNSRRATASAGASQPATGRAASPVRQACGGAAGG